jgi:hypothetical protein
MNIAHHEGQIAKDVRDFNTHRGTTDAGVKELPKRLLREVTELCVDRAGLLRCVTVRDRPGQGCLCAGE